MTELEVNFGKGRWQILSVNVGTSSALIGRAAKITLNNLGTYINTWNYKVWHYVLLQEQQQTWKCNTSKKPVSPGGLTGGCLYVETDHWLKFSPNSHPWLHTTASAIQHKQTWAAVGRVSQGAAAAEPQQSQAPSRLTVPIRVSCIAFTGCAELQTSFSRLTATFQTMTASLKLAQVCSTLCCSQMQRYKQICCVWESADWSVQFWNTSKHPISVHTGQNHSQFWHSCE